MTIIEKQANILDILYINTPAIKLAGVFIYKNILILTNEYIFIYKYLVYYNSTKAN